MVGARADNLRFVDDPLRVGALWHYRTYVRKGEAARSIVGRICASGRAENRAAAEMLVAIDDLYRLACREDGARDDWAIDTVEQVAAEVAAALRISQGSATARVSDAIAMRTRLPQVGKVFRCGDIDYFLFGAIVSRTELLSHDRLAAVDAELAATVARWPSLSRGQRIARAGPCGGPPRPRTAVRRRKKKRDDRGDRDLGQRRRSQRDSGFPASDGRPHPRRATGRHGPATVCRGDPRSPVQRRADAMGRAGRRRRSTGLRMR